MEHLVIIFMVKEWANKKDKTNGQNKKIKGIFLKMKGHPPTNVMVILLIFIVVIIIVRITLSLLMLVSIVTVIF
jgi:hypothetical protein